jgi:glutathione S-transferase
LSLQNPLFATCVIAATLMILKAVSMSWLTVIRMMQVKGGFRSPEDLRKTPFNREPNPKQLEPNEHVERIRRIQLNDLENLPFFLVAAFLYVLTEPSLLLARLLLYGYVISSLFRLSAPHRFVCSAVLARCHGHWQQSAPACPAALHACRRACSRQSRAMLIDARSSQDFACCARATASARSKYSSAFAASRSSAISAMSPAVRLISA